MPTILSCCTTVEIAVDTSVERKFEAFSSNYQERVERSFEAQATGHWTDYLLACWQQLEKRHFSLPSLKILVRSNIPIGAGVSSSAALEVACLKAVRALLNLNLSDLEIALIAQQAESEGVGMPCGVMDQIVVSLGQPNKALFLDTQDLSYEQIQLPQNYQFVVVHSGKTRALVASGYKERRAECQAAAALLQVSSLRDISWQERERLEELPHPLQERAMHVITENQRVLATVAALQENRFTDLGELMNASHLSQKNQFAVTIPETDALFSAAIHHGAIGARQTGGGFGGAIVALVPTTAVASWWDGVSQDCPDASLICRD